MKINEALVELHTINDNCISLLELIKQLQDQIMALTEELIKQDLEICLKQIGFPVDEVMVWEIVNNGLFKGMQ